MPATPPHSPIGDQCLLWSPLVTEGTQADRFDNHAPSAVRIEPYGSHCLPIKYSSYSALSGALEEVRRPLPPIAKFDAAYSDTSSYAPTPESLSPFSSPGASPYTCGLFYRADSDAIKSEQRDDARFDARLIFEPPPSCAAQAAITSAPRLRARADEMRTHMSVFHADPFAAPAPPQATNLGHAILTFDDGLRLVEDPEARFLTWALLGLMQDGFVQYPGPPPGAESDGEDAGGEKVPRRRPRVSALRRSLPAKRKNTGHVCPQCRKRFNRPSGLSTHMNVHSGAKPYVCPVPLCGKTFGVRSNARRHFRTHKDFEAGLAPPPYLFDASVPTTRRDINYTTWKHGTACDDDGVIGTMPIYRDDDSGDEGAEMSGLSGYGELFEFEDEDEQDEDISSDEYDDADDGDQPFFVAANAHTEYGYGRLRPATY